MLDHVGGDRLVLRECPRHGFFGIVVGQIDFVEHLQSKHPPLVAARRDFGRGFPTSPPTPCGSGYDMFLFGRHRCSSDSVV